MYTMAWSIVVISSEMFRKPGIPSESTEASCHEYGSQDPIPILCGV